MAASGSGGMKGGIRRLKARAVAVNVTTPLKSARPTVDADGIARILIEAATRAQLLADNSKDVFELDRSQPKPAIDLQALLLGALARS